MAIWFAALLAYSNSFENALIYDSNAAILQDSRVWSATADNINALMFQDYWYADKTNGLYRPLTKISYLFNYAILGNGPEPAGYHLINFALHAVNILLVYLLVLLVLKEFRLTVAAAAIWGLNPVLTEAVTNVVGRADLLAASGILAGLLCHVKASTASGAGRRVWLAGIGVAAAIGLFSKESAVVLPAVMLAYDISFARAASWGRRLAGYLGVAVPFSVYFYLRSRMIEQLYETDAGAFNFLQNPLYGMHFWTARLTAMRLVAKEVGLWVWPQHLSCDYSYNQIPAFDWRLGSSETLLTLVAIAGCVAAVAVAVRAYRSKPAIVFLVAFFFATLAPTSNLILLIGSVLGERFLYVPSIALAALMALAIFRAGGRLTSPKVAPVIVGVVCMAFAVRTYARNFDWRDERSLWASDVESAPGSYMTHLGNAMMLANDPAAKPEEIDREISRTLAIVDSLPDHLSAPHPFATAGWWFRMRGDKLPTASARWWYERALLVLLRARRIDVAMKAERDRRNNPKGKFMPYYSPSPGLYLDLGMVYLRLGEPGKAAETLEFARLLGPQPAVEEALASVYRDSGDNERAVLRAHEGLILFPNYRPLISQLVASYQKLDQDGCAVVRVGDRQAVNLRCARVQNDTCQAARNILDLYSKAARRAEADRIRSTVTWACSSSVSP